MIEMYPRVYTRKHSKVDFLLLLTVFQPSSDQNASNEMSRAVGTYLQAQRRQVDFPAGLRLICDSLYVRISPTIILHGISQCSRPSQWLKHPTRCA